MQLSTRITPETMSSGDLVTFGVYVSSEVNLVADATVTVSAGGGIFSGRQKGQTDSRGIFKLYWTCSPCASAYGFSIKAEKSGYSTAPTEASVRIN